MEQNFQIAIRTRATIKNNEGCDSIENGLIVLLRLKEAIDGHVAIHGGSSRRYQRPTKYHLHSFLQKRRIRLLQHQSS